MLNSKKKWVTETTYPILNQVLKMQYFSKMQREQKCRDAQDTAKDISNSASSFLEDVIITINFNHFQFDAYVIQYLEAQRQNQLPERPGIFLLIFILLLVLD